MEVASRHWFAQFLGARLQRLAKICAVEESHPEVCRLAVWVDCLPINLLL